MFAEALLEANEKDDEFNKTGRAEGDFWGLPSCFKGTSNVYSSILAVITRALGAHIDLMADGQITTLRRDMI